MDSVRSICEPRRWVSISKYLFPLGMRTAGSERVAPPTEQMSVKTLAANYPDLVKLTELKNEPNPELKYIGYTAGMRQVLSLLETVPPPAFVADIKCGMSFGRHCCAIGPDGKAVRETGFNLDGTVLSESAKMSFLRPRYWRKRMEGDVTMRPWLPRKRRVEGRVALLNLRYSHNFYHWLTEILPRLATLRRAGAEADYFLIDCRSNFQQDVLQSLGIKKSQLVQPHCRLLLEAEHLLVPSMPSPACSLEFSSMLATGLQLASSSESRRRIFISRRKTGTRTLQNENELLELLEAYGFEFHSMEEYPLVKQATLIRESELIVATHGAGLANLIFARPGTQVVEIVPAGRYNAQCYPRVSQTFRLCHQQIFAERARTKQILNVSLDEVRASIEEAIPEIAKRCAA